MHHGDIHTSKCQAISGFQPEQAAADDHRMFIFFRCGYHRVGVLDVAVANHTGQFLAGNRQDEGTRTSRQQQSVVFGFCAILSHHYLTFSGDTHNFFVQVQGNVVLLIPVNIVQDNVLDALFARQYRGQHDAVVIRIRLGTKYGNVIQIGRQFQ